MRTLQRHESLSGDNQQVGREDDSGLLFPEQLNIIFDSKCNVCQFEVDHLQSRIDKFFGGKSLIRFTDLESKEGYDESDPANGGVTYEMGMRYEMWCFMHILMCFVDSKFPNNSDVLVSI